MSNFDDYLKGELAPLKDKASSLHSSVERDAFESQLVARSKTRRWLRLSMISCLVFAVVGGSTIAAFSLSARDPGDMVPPLAGSSESPSPLESTSPTPIESASPTPSESPTPPDELDPDALYVFFLTGDYLPYEKAAYVSAERTSNGARTTEEKLRRALEELVAGPTTAERAEGLSSWFSNETAGLLNDVTVVDGTARIAFKDFTRLIPGAGTSSGGVAFQFSLNLTVFQFADIDQVEYSIEGDCSRFWEFLQVDECRPPFTRKDLERGWNALD